MIVKRTYYTKYKQILEFKYFFIPLKKYYFCIIEQSIERKPLDFLLDPYELNDHYDIVYDRIVDKFESESDCLLQLNKYKKYNEIN